MPAYYAKPQLPTNQVRFNTNIRYNINNTSIETTNNITISSNVLKRQSALRKNNNTISIYPDFTNTLIRNGIYKPYLPLSENNGFINAPDTDIFYTSKTSKLLTKDYSTSDLEKIEQNKINFNIGKFDKNTDTVRSVQLKIINSPIGELTQEEYNFINEFINQGLSIFPDIESQSFRAQQIDLPKYRYVTTPGGNCGECVLEGLYVNWPINLPVPSSIGNPPAATSCEAYYALCGDECVPPEWRFTFSGQVFPSGLGDVIDPGGGQSTYIEGVGCETIPEEIIQLQSSVSEAVDSECVTLGSQGIYQISFVQDTLAVYNIDNIPEGYELCSDIFYSF